MIRLTDLAIRKAKELMENANKQDWGLRVLVKSGGCSGLEYGLSLAERHDPDDQVFEFDDLRVFVDPGSSRHLHGVMIDYVDSLSKSGFKIENPNATSTCGCGSSFAV